jgi:integrase
MALYQNKKTLRWKAEVWFKGKRYASQYFATKALAQKFEREKLHEIESQVIIGIQFTDHTYNEIYGFWYQNASSRKRETSLIKDAQMHRDFIKPFLGNLKISEIRSHSFEHIVSSMLKKGLSKASINKVIQHFKAVFNHSFNNELIVRNPARGFKQLRLTQKEMDYFSQDEMDRLLTYTSRRFIGEERWKHALYLTLFLTGKRLGEALGLQWHQINFDKNVIIISQMWCAVEKKLIFTTKGRKDRVIPLNSVLKTELASIRGFSKSSFVFSDVQGKPIDPSNFRNRMWDRDLDACGIRQMRIHDTRHTYASLFMMNGGNLYELKEVLGHSSINTTERYAHLSNTHLANVRDIIKPNIGNRAEVISVNSFSKKLGASIPPQKSERGQDDVSISIANG